MLAPLIGAPLLAAVSDLPPNDWRVGAPYFASAILQAISLLIAIRHFRSHRIKLSASFAASDPIVANSESTAR